MSALNKSRTGNGVVVTSCVSPSLGTKEVFTLAISGSPTGGYVILSQASSGISVRFDLEYLIQTENDAIAYLKKLLKRFKGIPDCTIVRSGTTPNFTFTVTVNNYDNIGNLSLLSNGLTGGTSPTITPTVTTSGAAATGLGYDKGTVLVDESVGEMYLNLGTKHLPLLAPIGSRSWPIAKTANYTISAFESGKTFTNDGATGIVVFSLPAASPGLEFTFVVRANQHLRIDPATADTINKADGTVGAAGKYLGVNTVNSVARVKCISSGHWTLMSALGAWDLET